MRAIISPRSSDLIREYFAWWARQMGELLPGGLSAPESGAMDALVLEIDEGGASLSASLRRGERLAPLGRFPTDSAGITAARNAAALGGRSIPVWLRLPAVRVLEKKLSFPLVAERALRQALSYEMDRETPFTVDEVWWNWRVDERDRARGQIHLTLFLLPKSVAQPYVAALAQGGLHATAIDARTAAGESRQIMLGEDTARPQALTAQARPLAIACAVLALVAVVVPFARQSLALGWVEDRIALLQPQVEAVQALRRRVENVAGAGAASAMEQAGTADALKVLAKTTQILPDDTHLTDFTLHRRKLGISGQSAGAAKLIGLLAADPFFQDPAFAAAVTRVQGSKLDAFSINAEVRP
jgi:general secretion pathway protein L